MTGLLVLIPVSVGLGLLGLAFFIWSVRNHQYDDPDGEAQRILDTRHDDRPADDNTSSGRS
jgi:cbb3-type cytochrome oxidase maturation protein